MEEKAREMGYHRIAKGEANISSCPGFTGGRLRALRIEPDLHQPGNCDSPGIYRITFGWLFQQYTTILAESQVLAKEGQE
jgi:hypothetical protein